MSKKKDEFIKSVRSIKTVTNHLSEEELANLKKLDDKEFLEAIKKAYAAKAGAIDCFSYDCADCFSYDCVND